LPKILENVLGEQQVYLISDNNDSIYLKLNQAVMGGFTSKEE